MLIPLRSALTRVRVEVLLAICAGVGVFGIWMAEQRIVLGINVVNRFLWFEPRRGSLLEAGKPHWYRLGVGSALEPVSEPKP